MRGRCATGFAKSSPVDGALTLPYSQFAFPLSKSVNLSFETLRDFRLRLGALANKLAADFDSGEIPP